MEKKATDRFSADDQGLDTSFKCVSPFIQLLPLPEDTIIFLEKDDDLEFINVGGQKPLASVKHKAIGGRLTDLSKDFWQSVNIWLTRYKQDGCATSNQPNLGSTPI